MPENLQGCYISLLLSFSYFLLSCLFDHPCSLSGVVEPLVELLRRYSLPQELAEKYGEQIFVLQSIARTAVRDVDPQAVQ